MSLRKENCRAEAVAEVQEGSEGEVPTSMTDIEMAPEGIVLHQETVQAGDTEIEAITVREAEIEAVIGIVIEAENEDTDTNETEMGGIEEDREVEIKLKARSQM